MSDPITNQAPAIPTPDTDSQAPVLTGGESTIKGISIRGLITMLVVLTVCVLSCIQVTVTEPLYTMATVVVGFYFGHQAGINRKP